MIGKQAEKFNGLVAVFVIDERWNQGQLCTDWYSKHAIM